MTDRLADDFDVLAASITPCVRAGCLDIGTELVDKHEPDGHVIWLKVCLPCLRDANTAEGIDIEWVNRGHIGLADAITPGAI